MPRCGAATGRAAAGLLLALAATACAGRALASFAFQQDLGRLTERSTHVVAGRVAEVVSYWNAEHTLINTDVRIRVGEVFKGSRARGELVVQLTGGIVGEDRLTLVGSPEFQPGEEVLVFLTQGGGKKFHIVALARGKYRIEREADGSAWIGNSRYPLAQLFPGRSLELDSAGRMPLARFVENLRLLAEARVRASAGR